MSGLEIERKFLVHKRDGEYKRMACSSSRIKQGYICSAKGRTVRVRIRDGKGFLTIKGPSSYGGLTRYEFEKEITPDEAEHLMQLCEPGIIDKTRYLVPCGNHTFEVEVELSSEDEPYDKPGFIADEVTGDRRFYNSCLRQMPFSEWKDQLPEEYR